MQTKRREGPILAEHRSGSRIPGDLKEKSRGPEQRVLFPPIFYFLFFSVLPTFRREFRRPLCFLLIKSAYFSVHAFVIHI